MATRGRKPTPTASKELEGNPGKRPLNAHEPRPERKRAGLSQVAGAGGEKGVAAAGEKAGTAGRTDRGGHERVRFLLPGLCAVEGR